ncbi:SufB/SufD family protein [Neptunicoccus sediminis]|uniref:SufB/SufD family protein n=1 Tax=Neptunicoccus sediminis TaxID=1892596 RepID=UPI000845E6C5|nr:SufD family Fe-S cluster assembly protein [Neptunicoccus sediminis]
MSAKLKNKGVVPSITVPEGGKWVTTARQTAADLLSETGLPHRRDEYWKYTDPSTLTAPEATPAAIFESDEALPFADVDAVKIVFVDGVYDAAQSDALELAGVEIETLADAAQKDIHWAGSVYGVLEGRGQNPVSRPLASYNTAMAEQGFVIRATGKAAKPVSFIYLHESETSDAVIHHTIKLDEGADLTVLENGPAAARINAVMEVEVADKAAFHHVRAQGRDHERRTATHIFTRLGTESSFKSFTLTVNGVLTRNDAIIEFTGDDAHATVAGACAGDGAFHHDDTVFVTHDAVNCESRQVFKKVLRNGAVGVFQGKILVKPDAQKTDGYQISQGLLLDEDSTFQAKPELEIYADDVACSHGSTVGAIDETALFYLTSRGIPHKEAQDMLTLAFLGEAIDEVEDETLADDLRALLEGWMARRHG